MKATQTWKKLKLVSKMGLKADIDNEKVEEEVDKNVLYKIHPLQEPNYKNKISRNKDRLGCPTNFTDSFANEFVDIQPDPNIADKFKIVPPLEKRSGGNKTLAHSDCNTDNKDLIVTRMNHTEGGWPREVKLANAESKNKYIRKIEKEEMFKYTVIKLAESVDDVLKQNQTLNNMEQKYFEKSINDKLESRRGITGKAVTIVAKFKDFSKRRRPVSDVSWQKLTNTVAVAHCSPQFLGCHGESVQDMYLCDINHTAAPKTVFQSPSHTTSLDFNDKQCSLLASGCYDGSVCWYDDRSHPLPCGATPFADSHRDAVFGVKWVGKSGMEFLSGSQDGIIKWWDIRKFGKSYKELKIGVENADDIGEGITCMTYEPTIPSNFMVGTAQGNVLACKVQSKEGVPQILNIWEKCYQSKILSLERNSFYPKYFLTVGGYTSKIWSEDLKSDAILSMASSPSRLTSGAWSPSRMSMFFTTNVEGFLEIRDFLISHSSPVLQIKIADYALNCVKVHGTGSLLSVGAGDGSTSIVSMDANLISCSKVERGMALDMLERETRRERILENRSKALKVAEKQAAMKAKRQHEAIQDTNIVNLEQTEKLFFDTIRKLKLQREKKYYAFQNL